LTRYRNGGNDNANGGLLMAESKEAIRNRVRKFRALRKELAVTVTNVTQPSATEKRLGRMEERISVLEERLESLEIKQFVNIKGKPGERSNALYGA
jgi:hypothetical protein